MKRKTTTKRKDRTFILPVKFFSLLVIGVISFYSSTNGQTVEEQESKHFVTGTVLDANTKNPLVAVQIQALNQNAAAITDDNGSFKINISSPNEVLLVTSFDYYSREIPVQGRESIDIELFPDFFTNTFSKVSGLTGPVRSSYITNSISGIDEMGHPTAVSFDKKVQSMAGGSAHVISNSGDIGQGSTMFIRGLNSINLNAQPLLVVDGVIWNDYYDVTSLHDGFLINSLADIDLNDIEDVTLIKDGTSIYGSKGGNGVILVNTIRGEDLATKIVVNATGGVHNAPVSLPVMNGDQFRIYLTDIYGTTDIPIEAYDEMGFLQDDPTLLIYNKYHNNTTWDDEVYQQGVFQSYNIRVNGGDEKALYAFSLGYTGNQGVVKSTDMQRLNTRFNADFSMTDRISTGLNVGFTNVDRNLLDDGVNFYTSPGYLAMIKAKFLSPYMYTNTGEITAEPEDSDVFNIGNPTAIIANALNTNKHYRLNLGVKPEVRFSSSLKLSSLFDYSLDKIKETYYSPIRGVADQYIPGLGISENVFRSQQMRNITLFDDTQLNYTGQFGNSHRLNAIAGWRYITTFYEADYAEGHNSGSDQKRNLLSEQVYKNTTGRNDRIKSISNYLNLDYSFDNRYFATASMAVDGSSRFGNETMGGFQLFNRSWGVFPSITAGWLMSSEEFMSGVSFIDRLKIRGGFGVSGNDGLDPYAWTAYFNTIRYMDRANGLILDNLANSEIQWETSVKLSFGLDANLLNDRVVISADVYANQTRDLLTLRSLPEQTGMDYYWGNGGELSNQGFEVAALLKLINSPFLKWEVGANTGHYTNKILSLPDGDFTTSLFEGEILTSVGNPAGLFYGYLVEEDDVFTTQAEAEEANLRMIDNDGTEHYFGAGDIHFFDADLNGIIDEKDKQIIGDPNPDFYGSFNSRLAIWKFTIDALFTFSYGNEIYNYLRSQLESGSDLMNQTTAVINRWTYEGFETTQPRVADGDPMGNSRFSSRWIEDGSYLRLKSLSINYKIPVNSNAIEEINLWASANNLWTLTEYLGRDPEVSPHRGVLYQGIDTGLIPHYKSYFIGVRLNL